MNRLYEDFKSLLALIWWFKWLILAFALYQLLQHCQRESYKPVYKKVAVGQVRVSTTFGMEARGDTILRFPERDTIEILEMRDNDKVLVREYKSDSIKIYNRCHAFYYHDVVGDTLPKK